MKDFLCITNTYRVIKKVSHISSAYSKRMIRQKHFLFVVKVCTCNGNSFEVGMRTLFIMSPLIKEQKAKAVQFYWEAKLIVLTQLKFRSHFQTRKTSERKTILRLCEQLVREGFVGNLNKVGVEKVFC